MWITCHNLVRYGFHDSCNHLLSMIGVLDSLPYSYYAITCIEIYEIEHSKMDMS